MYCVYKIVNNFDHKMYIGQTKNIRSRWISHKTSARNKKISDSPYLYHAMNKYGIDNFRIEKIQECESLEEAEYFETAIIYLLDTRNHDRGYNITSGGFTYERTKEIRDKISNTLKGNIPWNKGLKQLPLH